MLLIEYLVVQVKNVICTNKKLSRTNKKLKLY
jgi:hypothetical protein